MAPLNRGSIRSEQVKATAIGGVAILLWSTLALLAAATRGIPPFETLAISFGVACLVGIAVLALSGRLGRLRQTPLAWAMGFAGLFTAHALYFIAIDNAPPAQAGLIAYLWPLLIVLFAALLPGGTLRARHLTGAGMGLAGTVLIVLGGNGLAGHGTVLGYACALGEAFVWSGYSVANRTISLVPSELIAGVCGAVSVAALIVHLATEASVMPRPIQWAALVALGIGPVGIAFYFWDHATKHGDLALLGTLSYAAPLLSTALLIAVGWAQFTLPLIAAAALIVGGAAVSASITRKH